MLNEPILVPKQGAEDTALDSAIGPALPVSLFERVERLFNQLSAQSPKLTPEFIRSLYDGEKGVTWTETCFFRPHDIRPIPLYPRVSQDAEKEMLYLGCATRTHHFYFGQLTCKYTIERDGESFVARRLGAGFDAGDRFVIQRERTEANVVAGPSSAYGGRCYPGGPPSRAVLTETTTTDFDRNRLEEVLSDMEKFVA